MGWHLIDLLNVDCMEYMAGCDDGAFDLAIVDPPYGIGFDGEADRMAKTNSAKWQHAKATGYSRKAWDSCTPDKAYFDELRRVSKNQIIWGGNYYNLPQSSGWIFWDKNVAKDFTLSPGELAWTSYDKSVKKIDLVWSGFRKCEIVDRIHPTQKPVKLYKWILETYADRSFKILDTHTGSGSSAIAAHYFGCDFVGCEIDNNYYQDACNRFDVETRQQCLI